MPRLALISAIALSVVAVPLRAAWATERVAVLVAGATAADGELAATVSELVESQVARTDADIAGMEEMRAKMQLTSETEVAACLSDLPCLSRAAIALRVHRVITGTVGRSDTEQFFSLEWRDLEDTAAIRRVFRRVPGGLPELARSAQAAVDELLHPPVPEPAPSTKPPPVATLLVSPAPAAAPAPTITRKTWPTKAVWAGLGLTAAALGTAAVYGKLAQGEPQGSTRGALQRSLEGLQREGTIADVALITAGVTGLVTAIIAGRYWGQLGEQDSRPNP